MDHVNINLVPDYITLTYDQGLSLDQIIRLLTKEHDDQVAMDLTRRYCLQSTSQDIRRKGMEFLYLHGYYDDLQMLIHQNNGSTNKVNHQWAEFYQIALDRRQKKKAPYICIQHLNRIKTEDPELCCLIELTKTACNYDQKEYGKIGNFLAKQHELFDRIEDTFILSSVNFRLYQQLFLYYWMRNEMIMARKYAFRALNQTNNAITKSAIHINLGLSYTFDTYSQGMYHLNEALKIAEKNNLAKRIDSIKNHNIPFLSAHFKQVEGVTSNDKSEIAHLEIAKGNNEKAIPILEKIKLDSPFKLYYMGLAKQDKELLLKSYNSFIERRSDYFFSRLPLNVLKNMA